MCSYTRGPGEGQVHTVSNDATMAAQELNHQGQGRADAGSERSSRVAGRRAVIAKNSAHAQWYKMWQRVEDG